MHKKGRVIGTWFLTELLYKTFTLAYQCLTQLVVDFNHSPQKCLLFLISDETYTPTLYPTELWAHYLNLIIFCPSYFLSPDPDGLQPRAQPKIDFFSLASCSGGAVAVVLGGGGGGRIST